MDRPKKLTIMIWHNSACAQNGTINNVKKYLLLFFMINRKCGFAVDVQTNVLRKEYDYIDYTFRST